MEGGELMEEKEFNLFHEPWIRVLTGQGAIRELSVCDVLLHAHEYQCLAGELVTQDVAVMRLLLAILQTIVYRYDDEGEENMLEDDREAFRRWKFIWDRGYFDQEILLSYLSEWEDRFWLFHPTRPFYQVPEAENGTECSAAKLNGMISESNNKIRLFSERCGIQKEQLTFSEAARWLLYVNGFDDTSAKPKEKGRPSVGVGWLGKLGLIYAEGENLFETLMLNLVLVSGNEEIWAEPKPQWELDTPEKEERTKISMPDNQAELLTLQSRRVLLKKQGDRVTGYHLLGGDFFDKENAFDEQMTVWQKISGKKGEKPYWQPKRHSPERQLWRDFANIFFPGEGERKPGIVNWIILLKEANLIGKKKRILFKTASVKYGDKDFFAIDVFGDYLRLQTGLFTDIGKDWEREIRNEVNICDQIAWVIGVLKSNLNMASGQSENNKDMGVSEVKEKYYSLIDQPFRTWISEISGEEDLSKAEEVRMKWRKEAYRLVREYGRELLNQAGPQAMLGHPFKDEKDKNKDVYWTSFDAWNIFNAQLLKYYELKGGSEPRKEESHE